MRGGPRHRQEQGTPLDSGELVVGSEGGSSCFAGLLMPLDSLLAGYAPVERITYWCAARQTIKTHMLALVAWSQPEDNPASASIS